MLRTEPVTEEMLAAMSFYIRLDRVDSTVPIECHLCSQQIEFGELSYVRMASSTGPEFSFHASCVRELIDMLEQVDRVRLTLEATSDGTRVH